MLDTIALLMGYKMTVLIERTALLERYRLFWDTEREARQSNMSEAFWVNNPKVPDYPDYQHIRKLEILAKKLNSTVKLLEEYANI